MEEQLVNFETAKEKMFKRGDVHPSKDLIFWQYHFPFYKETNGEVWCSPNEFEAKRKLHNLSTLKHRLNNPLTFLVVNTLQRGKKYKDNNINIEFINMLWEKQNGKCFWFNVDMVLESSGKKWSRNPLKVTIDRLDNSKGYIKDNVVLCTYAANCGRANCSVEQWKEIINIIKNGLITKSN